ncbi:MAG: hypothetical protein IMW91_05405 [Firmicutes bacterium]|nr:hypothetical protein [Bacillota bacterium]
MAIAILSLVVLVILFVVATVLPINIGSIALVASFVVGVLIAGLKLNDLFTAFPTNLFVLLAGITYMFAIAQQNGSMRILTNGAIRLVRGNVAIIPWVFHVLAIVISGIGAGPAASTAILAPMAMAVAYAARINPLLMGVMLVHGSHAGSMAPISPIGAIVNGTVAAQGLPDVSNPLFINALILNILIAVGAYLLLGGIPLIRRRHEVFENTGVGIEGGASSENAENSAMHLNFHHIATFVGIVLLLVFSVGFKLDVGFTAFTIGVVLALLSPKQEQRAINQIAWPTILMIGGILTYISVMTKVGGMDLISHGLTSVGSPLVSVMFVAAIGAITSLFSATGAVLGATIPLLAQVLAGSTGISLAGSVSTLAISSAVVDSSPMSLQGAVLIGAVQGVERTRFFRQLLLWGVAMVFVGTLVPWLLFVVLAIW